jgi:hypothetical protein
MMVMKSRKAVIAFFLFLIIAKMHELHVGKKTPGKISNIEKF